MSTDDIATNNRDNRVLSLTGFILFLVGFFLPFICLWAPLLSFVFASLGAELLALIFGLMSWRLKLGKVAAIGASVFWLIAITNFIRFIQPPHHSA